MPLCEHCSRIDFRDLVLRETDSDYSRWVQEFWKTKKLSDCTKHHSDLVELKECALGPPGCELCEVFFLSWALEQEQKTYCPELNEGLTIKDRAKRYLERRSDLCGRVLYAGSYEYQPSPGLKTPGIGLWAKIKYEETTAVMEEDGEELSDSIANVKFFLKRDSISPKDSPLREHIWMRDIRRDSRTPECMGIARRWLQDCLQNHALCQSVASHDNSLPTRIINVGDDCHDPRLEISNRRNEAYVTLSYCWGSDKSKHMILTKENMSRFQEGISLASLPGTLRDAIYVTRGLGVQYLWVDALCIVQDSNEDWRKEAARMNDVYSQSIITLFATTTTSAADGFLGERKLNPDCSLLLAKPSPVSSRSIDGPNSESREKVFLCFQDDFPHRLDDSHIREYGKPWKTRGWTLQERLSPARGLSFNRLQMSWHCLTITKRENGSQQDHVAERRRDLVGNIIRGVDQALLTSLSEHWITITRLQDSHLGDLSKQVYGNLALQLWRRLMNDLQERSLTYQSDRLPAVAGLAKTLEKRLEGRDRYWAGLWEGDWLAGLSWRSHRLNRYGSHLDLDRAPHLHSRDETTLAPSWSWSSTIRGQYDKLHDVAMNEENATTRSLVTIQPPKDIPDEERFIPTKPIVLLVKAPAKRLPLLWTCTDCTTEELDVAQAALQKWLRAYFCIENPDPKFCDAKVLHETQKRSEFAQKHRQFPGHHCLVVQLFERTPEDPKSKPYFISNEGLSAKIEMFFLVLESLSDRTGRYRRVAEITLLEEHTPSHEPDLIMERDGVKVYDRDLIKMVKEQHWPVKEIELV